MNGTIPPPLFFIQAVATPRKTPLSTAATSGTLYLVATPIGNLEDITVRALSTLRDVSVIEAEDTRRTAKLLRHYDIKTRTRSFHQHNERGETETVLSRLAAGESVAVVTDAGTPLLSDPGAKLVDEALRAGFLVQAIPGPSAVLAALVTSGLAASEFTFVGFPPSRSKDRKYWLKDLIIEPRPVVIFEAPHRIKRSLANMLEVLGDRQIAVCRGNDKDSRRVGQGTYFRSIGTNTPARGAYDRPIARTGKFGAQRRSSVAPDSQNRICCIDRKSRFKTRGDQGTCGTLRPQHR